MRRYFCICVFLGLMVQPFGALAQDSCPPGILRQLRVSSRRVGARAQKPINQELDLYTEFFSRMDFDRSLELVEQWRRYKNTPASPPRTWQLDSSENLEVARALKSRLERKWVEYSTQPTQYEERVLRLKTGDTVWFGEQSFLLGEYLGAGNATQIFALANRPDEVLRIPLRVEPLAAPLQEGAPALSARERLELNYRQTQLYMREILTYAGAVRVTGFDPRGRFLITQRVKPEYDGYRFLELLNQKMSNRDRITTQEWKKAGDLFELLVRNGQMRCEPGPVCILMHHRPERQYVYDRGSNSWKVVDAESQKERHPIWTSSESALEKQPDFPRRMIQSLILPAYRKRGKGSRLPATTLWGRYFVREVKSGGIGPWIPRRE